MTDDRNAGERMANNMKLEEAIAHLNESLNDQSHDWGCEECRQEHVQLREWLIELKERRAADVKPVVLCKDCKFSDWYTVDGRKRCFCYCMKTEMRALGENDFCSFGEVEETER